MQRGHGRGGTKPSSKLGLFSIHWSSSIKWFTHINEEWKRKGPRQERESQQDDMMILQICCFQPLSNGFHWYWSQTNRNYMELILQARGQLKIIFLNVLEAPRHPRDDLRWSGEEIWNHHLYHIFGALGMKQMSHNKAGRFLLMSCEAETPTKTQTVLIQESTHLQTPI